MFCKDTELVQTGADCLQREVSLESLEGSLSATPGRRGASGPGGRHRGGCGRRCLQAQEQTFNVWSEMNTRVVGRMDSSGWQHGAQENEEHGFSQPRSRGGSRSVAAWARGTPGTRGPWAKPPEELESVV